VNELALKGLDVSAYVRDEPDEQHRLSLMIDGMRCVACAFAIESALKNAPGVEARINVTDRRLDLRWSGPAARGNDFARTVQDLGYGVTPLGTKAPEAADATRDLFRAMAVAGFASGNIMLLSFVLWFAQPGTLGPSTRDFMHWISALIALPCVAYAGRPFFRSAWSALRHGRTNMDVPISLALVLACSVSLFETITHGTHAYFDSAVMLLFFLLVGRWLDHRARGQARGAAHELLLLLSGTADVIDGSSQRTLPIEQVRPGMLLSVPSGARIGADGEIEAGESLIDSSVMTGESVPRVYRQGDAVFAGMLNLGAPIRVRAGKAGENSLLRDIVTLMQQAEQRQSRYVRLADRIARYYTPVVHTLAASSFLLWWLGLHAPWQQAIMVATTVLIITCPCALALAVPAVQVVTSSTLFRHGILMKAADALERLAQIDTVYFDKTGTLTRGFPELVREDAVAPRDLADAAALAGHSHHVLAKALAQATPARPLDIAVKEVAGSGLEAVVDGETWRLGRRGWCGGTGAGESPDELMELWFRRGEAAPVRFRFADQLRDDAATTVSTLRRQGYAVALLSGDRQAVADSIGRSIGIEAIRADLRPQEKVALIEEAHSQHKVLMVGDGLNDAPALAAAHASMSPASAIDIAQNAADLVFQGGKLDAVPLVLGAARLSQRLVRQNLLISMFYNLCALPIAVSGHVTPLVAAIAMSSSSLIVILNALRASRFEVQG